MTYQYLYQDKDNRNCEGEIKARNREDAYHQLRKMGIRPYRVIGDDPVRWQPLAIALGYAALLIVIVVLVLRLGVRVAEKPAVADGTKPVLSAEEAREFRERAEDAVYRAPEAYRYNVWIGVNARLVERGLEPIPRPEGMVEDF